MSKLTLRQKVNNVTTKIAVVATPIILATSAHAEDLDIGDLSLGGLGVAAAGIFAIKAGPSLLMWGYRKILGFVSR
ncbi:hypothetical protein [Acinetobacter gerneri]|uniref:hypothetical protein n=1 Tax=Acinetobacter gerneri TaxID=202952 RepID=UPI0028A78834|nr:hypothetical protein [Acinetobacter gerneri]